MSKLDVSFSCNCAFPIPFFWVLLGVEKTLNHALLVPLKSNGTPNSSQLDPLSYKIKLALAGGQMVLPSRASSKKTSQLSEYDRVAT